MGLGTGPLARLIRGLRLDRNPLRRGSDRAETVILAALVAGFAAAAPFAAQAAGAWAYATSARVAQAQQAALRQVPATLLDAPYRLAQAAGYAPVAADARWRAPDGQPRTGIVFPPSGATAGSTMPVWVDQAGRLAGPPLGRAQLMGRARLAEQVVSGALALALIVLCGLARRSLDRRRMAAWDADWLATSPRP